MGGGGIGVGDDTETVRDLGAGDVDAVVRDVEMDERVVDEGQQDRGERAVVDGAGGCAHSLILITRPRPRRAPSQIGGRSADFPHGGGTADPRGVSRNPAKLGPAARLLRVPGLVWQVCGELRTAS